MPTLASAAGSSAGAKGSAIVACAPGVYVSMNALTAGQPTRWQKSPNASSAELRCVLYMAKMGSTVSSSLSNGILKMSVAVAVRVCAGEPPSHSWYVLGPEPTNAISAMYGRAQPFGQPVVRVTKSVSAMPIDLSRLLRRRLISGCTRSASAIARPHSGKDGQAIDLRVIASISWIILTPCSFRIVSTSYLSLGAMSRSTMDCDGVSVIGMSYLSTSSRSTVFRRSSGVSRTRPCSTLMPSISLPSPCSCQPIQSRYFHSGSGAHGSIGLPRYFSVSARKPSMPSVWTRYFSRADERTSRLPWSRCTARMAFIASKKSSLPTKPRWSAARANVSSFLWVRPMPPPTTMLKPLRVTPSGSMMTTQPMSLM
mmetsp:Transcript_11445/g.30178  ORF Transcript_11445/g.30178 Transcript_11445/m.30178 type:complete len:369 (-) Transcript_11445:311-1417(-)